jgi:hypothetical protein
MLPQCSLLSKPLFSIYGPEVYRICCTWNVIRKKPFVVAVSRSQSRCPIGSVVMWKLACADVASSFRVFNTASLIVRVKFLIFAHTLLYFSALM